MMRMESILPLGWCCTSLEKVATWGSGGTPSRNIERYFQGTIPWVKTGELESKYIRETEEHISEEALNNSSAKIFPKGSVGIAMYGATIGKLSIWGIDASTNQACAVGIPTEAINNGFLYYYLLSERQNLIKAGKGGAQPNLSQGIIKEWPIHLPPLNEQRRIVARIEELFSELDKGIENLKTARAQLKVYRQALLKHAFEGKLTAQWRAERSANSTHTVIPAQAGIQPLNDMDSRPTPSRGQALRGNDAPLEAAAALLKRIQQERAQRYQQQLSVWEASGKQGSKPKAPKPLPPLTTEELSELPELPEGWGWVRLGDILSVSSGSGLTSSQMNGGTFPVYGGNGISGYHDEYLFENETLILGRVGAKCGVVHITRHKSWITDNALIVEFLIHSLDQRYLKLRLEYLDLNKHSVSTAQPVISGSKIYPLFIGLPCLQEQIEIANQIESRLSEVDQLDQTIATSLQQAEALRQSILKKAFSGQLVPQDPHDEPAAALLARIKAERTTVAAKPRKNSTGYKLSPVEIARSSMSKES